MSETDIDTVASWAGGPIGRHPDRRRYLDRVRIPHFRGPDGVWTKNPAAERTATIQHYVADRDHRVRSWASRAGSPMHNAEPNAGHYALTALEGKGKLDTLVTQNIDGLHHAAGTSPERIVEIHGTVRDYACLGCGDRGPIEVVLERVRKGDEDPHCEQCGGLIKSATILLWSALIAEDLERSQLAAANCDLFLAIGTSLTVYPVAALPEIALQCGRASSSSTRRRPPTTPPRLPSCARASAPCSRRSSSASSGLTPGRRAVHPSGPSARPRPGASAAPARTAPLQVPQRDQGHDEGVLGQPQ